MMEAWKFPYAAGAPARARRRARAAAALVELLFIRRFSKAPRLILMVATIGISQGLAFSRVLLPRALDLFPADRTFDAAVRATFSIGVGRLRRQRRDRWR